MSETKSYNIVTFSNDECFALARALRARKEMLLGLVGELVGTIDAETNATRAYLLRQLDAVDSASGMVALAQRMNRR
jgi:hypothetical protein